MSVSTGENESGLKERVVKIDKIYTTVRSGNDVLVVEDSAGNEYSTLDQQKLEEYTGDKEEYVGETCKILFTVTRRGFLNFYHVLEKVPGQDPVEQEIDTDEYEITRSLDQTDKRITRQSAGHDAARVVQGMIASPKQYFSGPGTDKFESEVERELQKWTEYFKNYYRTGEWS